MSNAPEFSSSLDELLVDALRRPPGPSRESWIREACRHDEGLEEELRDLVAVHDSAGSFLAEPLIELPDPEGAGVPIPSLMGHYRVESEIGRGGMGVVFRGVDTRLDRTVAIKLLPGTITSTQMIDRLKHEAKALAALNHPNIAAIHTIEEHAGREFLVMEHVDGETLRERLGRGPMPIGEALHLCRQIAAALEAAHAVGIVHRDLKPANVKINADGEVKVLDFGLAKTTRPGFGSDSGSPNGPMGSSPAPMTRAGAIIGSVAYMSPEQARGQAIDAQADIWSLGVLLYECLTATNPFNDETTADTLGAVLLKPLAFEALPPETPSTVRRLIGLCLQRDRRRRLHDIRDVGLLLDAPDSEPAIVPAPPPRRRRRALQVSAGAAVLVLVAIASALIPWPGRATAPDGAVGNAPRAMRSAVPINVPASLWAGERMIMPTVAPDGTVWDQTLWGAGFVAFAISPDGRMLAYIGADPHDPSSVPQTHITVRTLHTAETRRLAGTEGAARLSFSPDGSRLAFVRHNRYERGADVRVVGVNGGTIVTALDSGFNRFSTPHWLSDSELIVVATAFSGLLRVPLDNGEPTPIEAPGLDAHGLAPLSYDPVPLPDGRSILVTILSESTSLLRVDLRSGQASTVVEDAEYGFVTSSGHLVFQRQSALWVARFNADTWEAGHAEQLFTGLARGPVACSRDGTLVFARAANDHERPLMAIDRDGQRSPLDLPMGAFRGEVHVSRDGRSLAANVIHPTRRVQAYIADLRGAVLPVRDPGPHPTFDARRIADVLTVYNVKSKRRRANLAIAKPRSAEPELWFDSEAIGGSLRAVEITRDGLYVVGVYQPDHEAAGGICVLPLTEPITSAPDVVVPTGRRPALSPDERSLAFSRQAGLSLQVFVTEFDPTDNAPPIAHQVSTDGGEDPFWSPDGSELYFIDAWDGNIMAVSFDRDAERPIGEPRQIIDAIAMHRLQTTGATSRRVDVLPDGRFVYVGRPIEQMPSHLDVVTNWFDDVRARLGTE